MVGKARGLLGVSMLFALGCATTPLPVSRGPQQPPESSDDFRVFVGRECKITDLKASNLTTAEIAPAVVALGAVLIPKIVEKVVDAGAGYLQKKKDALTTSYSARGSEVFFSISGGAVKPRQWLNCISLARGTFGKAEAPEDAGIWAKKGLEDLKLKRRPNFYADLYISYSVDGAAFQIRPVFVEFYRTAAKRMGKEKDILVTGYFEAPFLSEDDSSAKRFGAFQIRLPKMRENTVLTLEDLEAVTSQWIPLPPLPSEKVTEQGKEKTIYGRLPFTVFVTVQETEEAGDLLLQAVNVANETKADLSKVVSDEILKKLKKDEKKEDKQDKDDGGGVE